MKKQVIKYYMVPSINNSIVKDHCMPCEKKPSNDLINKYKDSLNRYNILVDTINIIPAIEFAYGVSREI